jgi:periplasmic divalent cation tolerance protein
MAGELIALVTCPGDDGERMARTLVAEELAACVNIVSGVFSVFRWEGKVEAQKEDLLIIKSNRSIWTSLEKRVKELHPYDTPEIICFPIEDGYKPYLDWMNSALRQ